MHDGEVSFLLAWLRRLRLDEVGRLAEMVGVQFLGEGLVRCLGEHGFFLEDGDQTQGLEVVDNDGGYLAEMIVVVLLVQLKPSSFDGVYIMTSGLVSVFKLFIIYDIANLNKPQNLTLSLYNIF